MMRIGLMVALLATCPIRLKNFAALEIGRSILKIDEAWWIVFAASEAKEKRPDERPIPDYIGAAIDKYVNSYRPILARGNTPTSALWLAVNGKPMTSASIADLLPEITQSIIGVKVNPHLFRAAAATAAAVHAGDNPHLGSAVLHHQPESTVAEENYNRATCISASRAHKNVVQSISSRIGFLKNVAKVDGLPEE